MAKLICIPSWLYETLHDNGQRLDNLATTSLLPTIVSKLDVINYQIAQVELVKLLMREERLPSQYELETVYNEIMGETLTDHPELSIYMKEAHSTPVNLDMLVTGARDFGEIKIEYVPSTDNKVIYLIVRSCASDSNSMTDQTSCGVDPIICKVLNLTHSGVRVLDECDDKSSAYRENPYLSQLYVKRLCYSA